MWMVQKKAVQKPKIDNPPDSDTRRYMHRRRILGLVSLAVVIALFGWLTYFIMTKFLAFNNNPEEFKAFIDSYGWKGRFVALGIQVLQIVIALIPGELVEVGTGYAFGAVEGTLICMIGVALASSMVFLLTRFLGVKLVEIFISREKIDELRFINSEEKLKRMIFLLFFIPGTPKDLLTYFAGLTRIKLHEFLIISMLARIPSLVSSTIGGHFIGQSQYLEAVILFVITGIVSLIGMKVYSIIVKKHKKMADDSPDSQLPEKPA